MALYYTIPYCFNINNTIIGSTSTGGKASLDTTKAIWQKITRKGHFPSTRCGSSLVMYKNKAILFGGVFFI